MFFFIFLNLYVHTPFCNEQKIYKTNDSSSFEKYHVYQRYSEKYCKCLKKISKHFLLKQKNQNTYSYLDQHSSLSEIQISNSFFNFKNIYLKNSNQLILHQLGYQFTNDKKIYNFGLGYRKYYSRWIIGNNVFYDTSLLPSKNDKKVLSIGNEFLKHLLHITINTYYDISNNHDIFNKNKKHLPFSYDIYIKNRIPFFTNTYSKINLEYFLDNTYNNKKIMPQKIGTQEKYPNNNSTYKLKLGLIYTPRSMFIFNINKTIFDSKKNNEMTFNVIANYKIHIPWIYPQKKIKNDIVCHNTNYETIWSASHHEYAIDRNYSTLLFQSKNINSNNTEEYIIQKNKKHIEKNKKNNHPNEINSNENTILHTRSNDSNKEQLDNHKISIHKEESINSELNAQPIQQNLIDRTNMIKTQNTDVLSNINNSKSSFETNTNKFHENQKQPLTNVNTLNISHSQKNLQIPSNSQETEKKLNETICINHPNVPTPPPMLNILPKNISITQDINPSTSVLNQDHMQNIKKNMVVFEKGKDNKFATLGSEEHLSKLNNITKKRKKTISTSSNESDLESVRLLRIIERQTILVRDNDSDSEDKESIISSNDFSE